MLRDCALQSLKSFTIPSIVGRKSASAFRRMWAPVQMTYAALGAVRYVSGAPLSVTGRWPKATPHTAQGASAFRPCMMVIELLLDSK